MKILLLDPYPKNKYRISKDTSGGYGTGNDFGDTLVAKFLKQAIKKNSDWPPLFAAYTFSSIKKNGHEINYKQELPADIDQYNLIIIVSSIVSHETEINVIKNIKKINKDKKIFIIGPFATSNSKLYLKYGVSVILGEPEFFFFQNKNLENFFNQEIILSNQKSTELEHLPYPDWISMGYDLKKINNLFGKNNSVPILGTRGCPFSCFKYCVYPLQQGRKVRQRTPKDIVQEIKFFRKNFNVKMFIFRDPVFSINRKHTVEFCNELINENLKVNFVIETHLKILDTELILLLKKSGLKGVKVGIESYSENILSDVNRYSEKKDLQKTKITELHKNNIMVSAMYIIAFPTDDDESVNDTINYSIKLNTAYSQFSVWTPYPGTPIFAEYENKIISEKLENFTQYQLVYQHEKLTKEKVRKLLGRAYSKYYLRLLWIIQFVKQLYFSK